MNHLDTLIQLALDEDIGPGDVTTEATIDENATSVARIICKEDLVLVGSDIAKRIFETLDNNISWTAKVTDGTICKSGDLIAKIEGKTRALLSGERVALNFLQHLSGIATLTRKFVDATKGTDTEILDTRKTTPGWRVLEKRAVMKGGGTNHRIGLYDHYLIKDNHIAAAGSIAKAMDLAKKARKPKQWIEIETRTMDEVSQAIDANADVIMLDNMSVDDVRKAVDIIGKRAKIEVSGNITLQSVRAHTETGVDFISVGQLTHSAPAADIHMLID